MSTVWPMLGRNSESCKWSVSCERGTKALHSHTHMSLRALQLHPLSKVQRLIPDGRIVRQNVVVLTSALATGSGGHGELV